MKHVKYDWYKQVQEATFEEMIELSPWVRKKSIPTMYSKCGRYLYLATPDIAIDVNDIDYIMWGLEYTASSFKLGGSGIGRHGFCERDRFICRVDFYELCNILENMFIEAGQGGIDAWSLLEEWDERKKSFSEFVALFKAERDLESLH